MTITWLVFGRCWREATERGARKSSFRVRDLSRDERHLIVRPRPRDLHRHHDAVGRTIVFEIIALGKRAERRVDFVGPAPQQPTLLIEIEAMLAARACRQDDDGV